MCKTEIEPRFFHVDWLSIVNLIESILRWMPMGHEPPIVGFDHPDEKDKELQQYVAAAESAEDEIEEYMPQLIAAAIKGAVPNMTDGDIVFFARRRLEFSRDLANLFVLMQDTVIQVHSLSLPRATGCEQCNSLIQGLCHQISDNPDPEFQASKCAPASAGVVSVMTTYLWKAVNEGYWLKWRERYCAPQDWNQYC